MVEGLGRCTHIYIFFCGGWLRCIMDTENGLGDPSSNPEQSSLHFIWIWLFYIQLWVNSRAHVCFFKTLIRQLVKQKENFKFQPVSLYYMPMPLRKAWIQLFFLKLWVKNETGFFSFDEGTNLGEGKLWIHGGRVKCIRGAYDKFPDFLCIGI